MDRWKKQLLTPRYGVRVAGAIQPVLEKWIMRRGSLTYRATQLLTGHECFGRFLRRIGRQPSAVCQHCGEGEDTADHTLSRCPAWAESCRVLQETLQLEGVVTLTKVVSSILDSSETWAVFFKFAENVMRMNEVAERERERDRETVGCPIARPQFCKPPPAISKACSAF